MWIGSSHRGLSTQLTCFFLQSGVLSLWLLHVVPYCAWPTSGYLSFSSIIPGLRARMRKIFRHQDCTLAAVTIERHLRLREDVARDRLAERVWIRRAFGLGKGERHVKRGRISTGACRVGCNYHRCRKSKDLHWNDVAYHDFELVGTYEDVGVSQGERALSDLTPQATSP